MQMFSPMNVMIPGLLIGIVFGFLLQKGQLSRFNIVVGQLVLRDFTVAKILLSALVVASATFYGFIAMNGAALAGSFSHVYSPAVVGGIIFGVGMALLGFCPGTCIAAAGEGARDALSGLLGMVVGGGLFGVVYPLVRKVFIPQRDGAPGIGTLATDLGVSHWWIILGLLIVLLVMISMSKQRGQE